MKLVSDQRCRIQSRELLKANTPYDAEIASGGRIVLTELVPKQIPPARLVRKSGRTCLETSRPITNEGVASARCMQWTTLDADAKHPAASLVSLNRLEVSQR